MSEQWTDAGALAERILTYFDSYRLGSVAPITCEIEIALKNAWQAGWDAGARVASRSAQAHYEGVQE